ncbi:MAG: hypothetical protein M1456_02800 [Actinobacteria bacterium]|nr:hypothetical protein [Actinomycetota bacterium]MCL5886675.1 hypothetical protein [Actinomycetota bacterium]
MTNPALQAPGCSRGEDVSKCSCREAVTAKRGSRPLSMGGWKINAACGNCPKVETVKRGSMTGNRDAMSGGVM